MLSEVFLTFAVTSFIGCFLGIVNACYKSKCKEIGFCCFTIKRDVIIEKEEDLEMIKNNTMKKENSV